MGEVTRFYNRDSDQDGPVSGSLQLIALPLDTAVATDTTVVKRFDLPAGMEFEITDIFIVCGTVTAAATGVTPPQVNVGTVVAGTSIVATAELVTGDNVLEIKDGTVAAGGSVNIRIVSATNSSAALPVSVNVVGHVAAPPTSVAYRS